MSESMEATIAVQGQRITSLEHRVKTQEERTRELAELTLSVKELALAVKGLTEKTNDQEKRLRDIEDRPADAWTLVQRTALTAIVSAIAGGLAVIIVQSLATAL